VRKPGALVPSGPRWTTDPPAFFLLGRWSVPFPPTFVFAGAVVLVVFWFVIAYATFTFSRQKASLKFCPVLHDSLVYRYTPDGSTQ
jgi:hypothetical protein